MGYLLIIVVILFISLSIRSARLARNGAKLMSISSQFNRHFYVGKKSGKAFTLLLIGDSTAVGTGNQTLQQTIGWQVAEHISQRGHYVKVENRGENFATYSDIVAHQLNTPYQADLVVVLAGANDAIRPKPPEVFQRHVNSCLAILKTNPGIFLFTEAPDLGATRAFLPPVSLIQRKRVTWQNNYVRRKAHQEKALLADLYTISQQAGAPALSMDLLHPNPLGYALWVQSIVAAMAFND